MPTAHGCEAATALRPPARYLPIIEESYYVVPPVYDVRIGNVSVACGSRQLRTSAPGPAHICTTGPAQAHAGDTPQPALSERSRNPPGRCTRTARCSVPGVDKVLMSESTTIIDTGVAVLRVLPSTAVKHCSAEHTK